MARGRLIYPFVAEIAPLDTAATEAIDPPGPVSSGFDEDFRTVVKVSVGNEQVGTSQRQEGALIQIEAQIDAEEFERLEMMLSGDSPNSRFRLILHFKELERLGFVDADGRATFKKGDRLHRILDKKGNLVQTIPNPPGLYVQQAMPRGWGLGGSNPKRNLLFLDFQERETSISGAGG